MGLTKDQIFFDAFNDLAAKSVEASQLLVKMLKDLKKAPELSRKIKDLEHEGDKITHGRVAALHQTSMTPLDRDEIRSLIGRLDDVLDCIEAASERVTLFEIKETTTEGTELAESVVASCLAIQSAVKSLRDLKHSKTILDLCIEINKHENAADILYRQALAKLFNGENDPVFILKWRDIYDHLEVATDRGEDVANIIEGIVLEHA